MVDLPVNLSNHSTGITYSHDSRWDVFGHDRACTNDCAIANRYARQYNHIRPNPTAIADGDGFRVSPPTILSALRVPVGCQAVGKLDEMLGLLVRLP